MYNVGPTLQYNALHCKHCQTKVGNSHKMKMMTRCEVSFTTWEPRPNSQNWEQTGNPDRWCCQNEDKLSHFYISQEKENEKVKTKLKEAGTQRT